MGKGSTEKLSIRINAADRPFLDDECLRIMQERFSSTRRLRQPSLGDVISELLQELRELRATTEACECQASAPAQQ